MNDSMMASYAATTLRVASGGLFIAHGLMKVFVFTIPGTVGYFESLGLPGVLAYLIIFAEIIGGVGLVLGLATRTIALATLPILLGATWVHSGNGWAFSSSGGGWEFPLFWAVVQLTVAMLGSGAYALQLPVAKPIAQPA